MCARRWNCACCAVGTFLLPPGIVHLGFPITMMVLAAVLRIGMLVSIA